jgi:hypothetical protein
VVLDDTLGGFLSADGVGAVLVSAGHRVSFQKLKHFVIDTTVTHSRREVSIS